MLEPRSAYENLTRMNFFGAGQYDIPIILKDEVKPENFIGFNYAKSCKDPNGTCIHFFLDDYQFTRLWNIPDNYINLLSKFECVCSPDFDLHRFSESDTNLQSLQKTLVRGLLANAWY